MKAATDPLHSFTLQKGKKKKSRRHQHMAYIVCKWIPGALYLPGTGPWRRLITKPCVSLISNTTTRHKRLWIHHTMMITLILCNYRSHAQHRANVQSSVVLIKQKFHLSCTKYVCITATQTDRKLSSRTARLLLYGPESPTKLPAEKG